MIFSVQFEKKNLLLHLFCFTFLLLSVQLWISWRKTCIGVLENELQLLVYINKDDVGCTLIVKGWDSFNIECALRISSTATVWDVPTSNYLHQAYSTNSTFFGWFVC